MLFSGFYWIGFGRSDYTHYIYTTPIYLLENNSNSNENQKQRYTMRTNEPTIEYERKRKKAIST